MTSAIHNTNTPFIQQQETSSPPKILEKLPPVSHKLISQFLSAKESATTMNRTCKTWERVVPFKIALDLSATGIDNARLARIIAKYREGNCRILSLDLSDNQNITDDGMAALSDLTSLTHLYLIDTPITKLGIAAHLKGLTSLTHIINHTSAERELSKLIGAFDNAQSIRRAYHRWSVYGGHPDKGGDTALFQRVLNLFETVKLLKGWT